MEKIAEIPHHLEILSILWIGGVQQVELTTTNTVSVISLMWKIHPMSIFLRFGFELLRSWSCVQVGGSASLSQNMAGFLHHTWSLWTDRRRQRMSIQTTKASCYFLDQGCEVMLNVLHLFCFNSVVFACRRAPRHHQRLQSRAGGRDLSGHGWNHWGHSQAAGWVVGRQVWSTHIRAWSTGLRMSGKSFAWRVKRHARLHNMSKILTGRFKPPVNFNNRKVRLQKQTRRNQVP